jgi:hypothetical protein
MLRLVLGTACSLCCDQPPACSATWASFTQRMRDQLHWLPAQQRIIFKLCTMAFTCMHTLSCSCSYPPVSDVFQCCDGSSTLSTPICSIWTSPLSGIRLSTVGRRRFYHVCPAARNALPPTLTANSSLSLMAFKKQLKTFLIH